MSLSNGAISISNGLYATFPSFRLHLDCYSHMITTVTKKLNVQKVGYFFWDPDSALNHIESQVEKDALSVSIKRFVFNKLFSLGSIDKLDQNLVRKNKGFWTLREHF